MDFPLEGSPFANQLVGYIAFRDNHAASSTFWYGILLGFL